MFSPAKSLVTAFGAALVALLPLVGAVTGARAGAPRPVARFHRALRTPGPGRRVDRRHAEGAPAARSRHLGGRSVLRVLPPLRTDSPQRSRRRPAARIRDAVDGVGLHLLGRRLHRHQRARRRRSERSDGAAHRQARIHREGHRHRQAHRRRAAEDRSEGSAESRRSAIPTSSRSANGSSRSASRSASRTR